MARLALKPRKAWRNAPMHSVLSGPMTSLWWYIMKAPKNLWKSSRLPWPLPLRDLPNMDSCSTLTRERRSSCCSWEDRSPGSWNETFSTRTSQPFVSALVDLVLCRFVSLTNINIWAVPSMLPATCVQSFGFVWAQPIRLSTNTERQYTTTKPCNSPRESRSSRLVFSVCFTGTAPLGHLWLLPTWSTSRELLFAFYDDYFIPKLHMKIYSTGLAARSSLWQTSWNRCSTSELAALDILAGSWDMDPTPFGPSWPPIRLGTSRSRLTCVGILRTAKVGPFVLHSFILMVRATGNSWFLTALNVGRACSRRQVRMPYYRLRSVRRLTALNDAWHSNWPSFILILPPSRNGCQLRTQTSTCACHVRRPSTPRLDGPFIPSGYMDVLRRQDTSLTKQHVTAAITRSWMNTGSISTWDTAEDALTTCEPGASALSQCRDVEAQFGKHKRSTHNVPTYMAWAQTYLPISRQTTRHWPLMKRTSCWTSCSWRTQTMSLFSSQPQEMPSGIASDFASWNTLFRSRTCRRSSIGGIDSSEHLCAKANESSQWRPLAGLMPLPSAAVDSHTTGSAQNSWPDRFICHGMPMAISSFRPLMPAGAHCNQIQAMAQPQFNQFLFISSAAAEDLVTFNVPLKSSTGARPGHQWWSLWTWSLTATMEIYLSQPPKSSGSTWLPVAAWMAPWAALPVRAGQWLEKGGMNPTEGPDHCAPLTICGAFLCYGSAKLFRSWPQMAYCSSVSFCTSSNGPVASIPLSSTLGCPTRRPMPRPLAFGSSGLPNFSDPCLDATWRSCTRGYTEPNPRSPQGSCAPTYRIHLRNTAHSSRPSITYQLRWRWASWILANLLHSPWRSIPALSTSFWHVHSVGGLRTPTHNWMAHFPRRKLKS